jgi:ABC-type Fe3+ transport system permease subunit
MSADWPVYPTATLTWVQWLILAAVPTLTFGVGSLVLNRWERLVELVHRARAAERSESPCAVSPGAVADK